MIPAVIPPVVAVLSAPPLLAISLVLFVVGIGGKFLLLPKPLSGALTRLVTAIALIFDTPIGGERTATMGATNWLSHDFLPRKP
jgi:CRISPR/Cas system CSM-associated protein Csm4 (group 5 of RAMP superfamily)